MLAWSLLQQVSGFEDDGGENVDCGVDVELGCHAREGKTEAAFGNGGGNVHVDEDVRRLEAAGAAG